MCAAASGGFDTFFENLMSGAMFRRASCSEAGLLSIHAFICHTGGAWMSSDSTRQAISNRGKNEHDHSKEWYGNGSDPGRHYVSRGVYAAFGRLVHCRRRHESRSDFNHWLVVAIVGSFELKDFDSNESKIVILRVTASLGINLIDNIIEYRGAFEGRCVLQYFCQTALAEETSFRRL